MIILTIKDIAQKTGTSQTTAGRLYRDIKKEYNIKKVCEQHLKNYLNVS